MGVLLFFVDGVGIGQFNRTTNPLAKFPSPFFPAFIDRINGSLPFDGAHIATDVSMGIAGLPQSATGQTALLTGRNAAKLLGRHHPGFPSVTLRKLLAEESIFLKLERVDKTATFANVFSPAYFERPDRNISATAWSLKASSYPFRWVETHLQNQQAVCHDLTNEFLVKLGFATPIVSPEKAGEILANLTDETDFCLFEYFLTDRIGHSLDWEKAGQEIDKLTRCLQALLENLDLTQHMVILTSDHGNFEDFSVPVHTNNHVATCAWGEQSESLLAGIRGIEDICAAILKHV